MHSASTIPSLSQSVHNNINSNNSNGTWVPLSGKGVFKTSLNNISSLESIAVNNNNNNNENAFVMFRDKDNSDKLFKGKVLVVLLLLFFF